MSLEDVFGQTQHVNWAQECARAILIFVYGLVLVRVSGRRTFGKWSALDIIVSIIVGSSLSRALTGSAPLWGTLAATTLLMALHWILAHACALSRKLSTLLEGNPIRLGQNGTVDPSALKRKAISEHDLNEARRGHGLQGISGVKLLMLEPSGKISVLKDG